MDNSSGRVGINVHCTTAVFELAAICGRLVDAVGEAKPGLDGPGLLYDIGGGAMGIE